jgi:hypothetical protein
MMKALVAIRDYAHKFKPEGEQALRAQIQLIEEIARQSIEWVEAFDRGEDMSWT